MLAIRLLLGALFRVVFGMIAVLGGIVLFFAELLVEWLVGKEYDWILPFELWTIKVMRETKEWMWNKPWYDI